MTEHATHQPKEFARRFDGRKYLITVDDCAEHRHKELHGKMQGATMEEELRLNDEHDERLQTIYSQHSPNENEGPIAHLNQMLKFENTTDSKESDHIKSSPDASMQKKISSP